MSNSIDTSPAAVAPYASWLLESKHSYDQHAGALLTALAKRVEELDLANRMQDLVCKSAGKAINELQAREARLRAPMVELLAILDTVETTDEGREFHPTTIQTCRCMAAAQLDKIMQKIRDAITEVEP